MNILRLIPAFRTLLAEKADLEQQLSFHVERANAQTKCADHAEQEMQFWRARANEYLSKFEAEAKAHLKSTQTVADWEALRIFGQTIYGTAPVLPETPEADRFEQYRRPNTRQAVRQQTQQFNRAYAKSLGIDLDKEIAEALKESPVTT